MLLLGAFGLAQAAAAERTQKVDALRAAEQAVTQANADLNEQAAVAADEQATNALKAADAAKAKRIKLAAKKVFFCVASQYLLFSQALLPQDLKKRVCLQLKRFCGIFINSKVAALKAKRESDKAARDRAVAHSSIPEEDDHPADRGEEASAGNRFSDMLGVDLAKLTTEPPLSQPLAPRVVLLPLRQQLALDDFDDAMVDNLLFSSEGNNNGAFGPRTAARETRQLGMEEGKEVEVELSPDGSDDASDALGDGNLTAQLQQEAAVHRAQAGQASSTEAGPAAAAEEAEEAAEAAAAAAAAAKAAHNAARAQALLAQRRSRIAKAEALAAEAAVIETAALRTATAFSFDLIHNGDGWANALASPPTEPLMHRQHPPAPAAAMAATSVSPADLPLRVRVRPPPVEVDDSENVGSTSDSTNATEAEADVLGWAAVALSPVPSTPPPRERSFRPIKISPSISSSISIPTRSPRGVASWAPNLRPGSTSAPSGGVGSNSTPRSPRRGGSSSSPRLIGCPRGNSSTTSPRAHRPSPPGFELPRGLGPSARTIGGSSSFLARPLVSPARPPKFSRVSSSRAHCEGEEPTTPQHLSEIPAQETGLEVRRLGFLFRCIFMILLKAIRLWRSPHLHFPSYIFSSQGG
jgi:hypothetical protein